MMTTWMQNIHKRKPPPEGCKYLRGLLQRTLHNITSKGNPTRNGKNHSLIGVTKIVLFQDEEDGVMSPKLPSKNKSNITSIASKQTKQSNWWLGYGHRICSLMDFHSPSLQQLRSSHRESFDWQTDRLSKSMFHKDLLQVWTSLNQQT